MRFCVYFGRLGEAIMGIVVLVQESKFSMVVKGKIQENSSSEANMNFSQLR